MKPLLPMMTMSFAQRSRHRIFSTAVSLTAGPCQDLRIPGPEMPEQVSRLIPAVFEKTAISDGPGVSGF